MDWLMDEVCRTAGVKPVISNVPTGVEILERRNENGSWIFFLNHSAEKVTVSLPRNGIDLLTDTDVKDSIELEPGGVAVLQLK
jgi:beta-galactosidase